MVAWVESIAYSMHSNCSKGCSIIWRSGSAREMPKLVFRWVLSVEGGAECLYSGAIGVWAPKVAVAGVADGTMGDGEPRGTITDLEVGGGKPRGTVLKPKLFKGY
jgi:hypothetical protein